VKFQQNALQSSADVVYIWNGATWVAYWFDGTQWINETDEFSDSGNSPIFADEAIWVARKSTGTIEYSITGTVPAATSLALEVPASSGLSRRFTFISNPFPTDVTLANLNLRSLT